MVDGAEVGGGVTFAGAVAIAVDVSARVLVIRLVAVLVGVAVGALVGIAVDVLAEVGVRVGVLVGTVVGVLVGDGVLVGRGGGPLKLPYAPLLEAQPCNPVGLSGFIEKLTEQVVATVSPCALAMNA